MEKEKELSENDLAFLNVFNTITGVMPSEWEEIEGTLFFLVPESVVGKAIGKAGINIQKLEKKLNKKLFVFAESKDIEQFVKNFFNNIEIKKIEITDIMDTKAVTIVADEKDKKRLIGKDGLRIKGARAFLKRLFNSTLHVKTKGAV